MFTGSLRFHTVSPVKSTAEQWVDTGLQILVAEGEQALTIENLLQKMKLTKGSFYHHFSGRAGYIEHLINSWKEKMTHSIIDKVNKHSTPLEMYTELENTLARTFSPEQEIAIRAWGLRSEEISRAVAEVDSLRTESLAAILRAMEVQKNDAQKFSRMIYSSFIGAMYIYPSANNKEQRKWNDLLWSLIFKDRGETK